MTHPSLDPVAHPSAARTMAIGDPNLAPSAVSWGAILGGAAAAAALSLILIVLGMGLGFTAVSPWQQSGASATAVGVSSIIWLILTSLVASALGGYVTGRLRARWPGTHGDEVYFRDTAHGFLAWAVATLVTVGLLTSAIGSIVGAGVEAGASVAGTAASAATSAAAAAGGTAMSRSSGPDGSGLGYFTDSLFRKDAGAASAGTTGTATSGNDAGATQVPAAEVTRIFVQGLKSGSLAPEDTRYLGQLVAQRTGLSQADAERRVTDVFGRAKSAADEAATKAKQAADAARKAAAYAALWIFISLLVGAFGASLAATFGGRQRDR